MFFIAFYCVLLRYLLKPPLAKISDDNIPLVLTFHPFNYKVRDVISRNFQILKNDPETSVIFTNNPSIFSCSRARRYTCSFFNSATSISGPKSNFVIQHNFTCTSSNIIYCISCSKCCKLYISGTGRRLSDRFCWTPHPFLVVVIAVKDTKSVSFLKFEPFIPTGLTSDFLLFDPFTVSVFV